ncbi:MAG: ATP-binding cassette domain-containing protein [Ignavibacteriales bacterium]|nr:ATP-binding cassette domain-containing protein [Ignavibacteriales bacterium]
MPLLETADLRKVYRADEVETTALDDVSISIDEGEFVSVMGPSGCGKSTLLHILGLLDNPTSGAYRFMGEDVARMPERKRARLRKRNIGFVFQSFNLIDELTIFENVELPLSYLKIPSAERRRRTAEALERMELMHRADRYPRQLSGGQQQRAAVARAAVAKPALVLADEPTGNLDSTRGDEVMNILAELNDDGATVVSVTHSPAYAEYGNRVLHLFDGKIVTENIREKFRV